MKLICCKDPETVGKESADLFAAHIFANAPVVILFMCIEKNLTGGLTAGGVKG